MSATHPMLAPPPGPDCVAFASLLPVLDEDGTDAVAARRLREHLPTCDYCQRQLAAYDRLEAALLRYFGPDAAPSLTVEDIMDNVKDLTDDAPAPATREGAPATAPGFWRRPTPLSRALSGVAAIAAVLLVAVLAQALFGGRIPLASHGRRPRSAAAPAPTVSYVAPGVVRGSTTGLYAASFASPSDGWAVGQYDAPSAANSTTSQVLFYHFDGQSWQLGATVPVTNTQPCPCFTVIQALSMDAPDDGWAVGGWNGAVLLHYDGRAWTQIAAPSGAIAPLHTVQMLSPTVGWAAGDNGTMLRYDGRSWTAQRAPPTPIDPVTGQAEQLIVDALAMVSPDNGWAAGELGGPQQTTPDGMSISHSTGVVLHYSGGTWRIAATWPDVQLHGLATDASGTIWAVGERDTYAEQKSPPGGPGGYTVYSSMLMLRGSGGHWTTEPMTLDDPSYANGMMSAIQMNSPTDGWAFGPSAVTFDQGPDTASDATLLLHYHAGRWTQAAMPVISGRARVTPYAMAVVGPNALWLIGDAEWDSADGLPYQDGYLPTATPLILGYQNGHWTTAAH